MTPNYKLKFFKIPCPTLPDDFVELTLYRESTKFYQRTNLSKGLDFPAVSLISSQKNYYGEDIFKYSQKQHYIWKYK